MGIESYEHPYVTTDTVLFTTNKIESKDPRAASGLELKVLLIKQEDSIFKDKWSIPGGFVDINKTDTESNRDTLLKKVGIYPTFLEQLFTYCDVDRDPRNRVISIAYIGMVKPEFVIENQKKMEDNTQFNKSWATVIPEFIKGTEILRSLKLVLDATGEELVISESDYSSMAFDHGKMIYDAFVRIKNKLDYTGIVYNMVSRYFTINELRTLYNLFKGKEINNFRRQVDRFIKETRYMSYGGHRPAKLYTYNNNLEG